MAATGLTPAEHAMLGLVSLGPRHGYEIAAHFGPEGDLGMVCQLPMSLLYAQLKRLEGLGYLEGTTELQANRPPRRVYRLTPEARPSSGAGSTSRCSGSARYAWTSC